MITTNAIQIITLLSYNKAEYCYKRTENYSTNDRNLKVKNHATVRIHN